MIDDREEPRDRFDRDLNPENMAGMNIGVPRAESEVRRASEIKEIHDAWPTLTNDQLDNIPVLREGVRLLQNATYFDLRHPERGEFTATANMQAEPGCWLVPKNDVGYPVWNRIVGTDPDRRVEESTRRRSGRRDGLDRESDAREPET